MNVLVKIFRILFLLITGMSDVYVISCLVGSQKCTMFWQSVGIGNWISAAIIRWIVILIYYYVELYQKGTCCQKVLNILASQRAELDDIRDELNYLNENSLIIDSEDK